MTALDGFDSDKGEQPMMQLDLRLSLQALLNRLMTDDPTPEYSYLDRRDGLGAGGSPACTTVMPPIICPDEFLPEELVGTA